jgi:hypothetical protein
VTADRSRVSASENAERLGRQHPSVRPDRSSPDCASAASKHRSAHRPNVTVGRNRARESENVERQVLQHPSVHPDRSSLDCVSTLPRDRLAPFPTVDRSQRNASENAERLARHRSVRPDRSRDSVDLNPAHANAAPLARRPNDRPRHRQDCVSQDCVSQDCVNPDCVNAVRKDRQPDHSRVVAIGPPPAQPLCILPGRKQDRVSGVDPEVGASNAASSRG